MKRIVILLSVCSLLIIVCMLYLLKAGVSLRTAPYIRPSVISSDFQNVAQALFVRLFPDLQNVKYIFWGFPKNEEANLIVSAMQKKYELQFHKKINFLQNVSEISTCTTPCWVFLSPTMASELAGNSYIKALPPGDSISISWLDFVKHQEVPEHCIQEKLLDIDCLKLVSVKDVERKFRDAKARYFFMRKYLEHDYFLFIEKQAQQ